MIASLLSLLLIPLLSHLCLHCYLLSHLVLSGKFHQSMSPLKYPRNMSTVLIPGPAVQLQVLLGFQGHWPQLTTDEPSFGYITKSRAKVAH